MKTTSFKYTKPFYDHLFYHFHAVDEHNNLCHTSTYIGETWITQRWPNQVFAYLFDTSDVNNFLAHNQFHWNEDQLP